MHHKAHAEDYFFHIILHLKPDFLPCTQGRVTQDLQWSYVNDWFQKR